MVFVISIIGILLSIFLIVVEVLTFISKIRKYRELNTGIWTQYYKEMVDDDLVRLLFKIVYFVCIIVIFLIIMSLA